MTVAGDAAGKAIATPRLIAARFNEIIPLNYNVFFFFCIVIAIMREY